MQSKASSPAGEVDDPALLIDPHAARALVAGEACDPFALLGPHAVATEGPAGTGRDTVIRAFVPPAEAVEAIDSGGAVLTRLSAPQTTGLY
ncbi:MAG: GlgB N-terminal domain-containing protein, partial [Steroidobacteraceae bacterium]